MSNHLIHNVRFYKPEVKGIHHMAYDRTNKKLAVSRSDNRLEIWNLHHTPFVERTIPPSTQNNSIEELAWYGNRLFSVGLHGLLIEYDLYKLEVKSSHVVTGEVAFCLDIDQSSNQIAVGTEQGYLNIFEIRDDEIYFLRFFDKQEGRILCLKYDHTGQFIVSGSLDTVRIWNVATGHAIHKMSTARTEAKTPTVIWTLRITRDFTIISGDSRGKLTFWDGKTGSQVESYQSHRADVLAICLSDNESSLYCTGVDPIIINYEKIAMKNGTNRWVKSVQRNIHHHDVRALILDDNRLYSGGIDGYLVCSYHPPKTVLKYPPIMQGNSIELAPKLRLVLLKYIDYLELWSLGECEGSDPNQLKNEPKKLLHLQKDVKESDGNYSREGIYCATISNDGKWIMYSTRLGVRLFKFIYDSNKPNLVPCEILENDKSPCLAATFSPRNHLIVAKNRGVLQVINLSKTNPFVQQTLETPDLTDVVTILKVSSCGGYLVAADVRSNILVWHQKDNTYKFYVKLPKYTAIPVTMSIQPKTLNLLVIYADNNLVEYELLNKKLSKFSRNFIDQLNTIHKNKSSIIRNVMYDPKLDNMIIMHDDSNIIIIDKNQDISRDSRKVRKLNTSGLKKNVEMDESGEAFHYIKKYKYLVNLSFLNQKELVAVELSPISLLEKLPPCLFQNTFGRK